MSLPASSPSSSSVRTFLRLATLTVAAVYFLILVGGIVRATGSGMGCPDWPKCFGTWIPPTDVSQLPSDYQERYAEHGYGDQEFNVAKTWTEYVNRLVGVVIGFLIFATMIVARKFRISDPPVFWWSVAAFLLVGFQGWLGSVVVATNLAVWMVTLHMLVALVIVAVLIYVLVRARVGRERWLAARGWGSGDSWFAGVSFLTLTQIAMGTQVRERIDELSAAGVARFQWIAESGLLTLVHRSFSLLLMLSCFGLFWWLRRNWPTPGVFRESPVGKLVRWVIAVALMEVVAGVILFYFSVPAVLQPVHLLGASLLAGLLFAGWMLWRVEQGSIPRSAAAT